MKVFDQLARISHEIDRRSADFEFGNLQEIRKRLKGLSRKGAHFPFDRNAEKFAAEGWIYHVGGRQEMQFNIGFEPDGQFRYGVAFSLETSQSTNDPVTIFRPKIERFNQYLLPYPDAFQDLELWYYRKNQRQELVSASPIPEDWVQLRNFIFLGKRVSLPISEAIYQDILETFDRLLPLYEYVEEIIAEPIANARRIARICWNNENWQRPSGRQGKSVSLQTHEGTHGWGGEEWLFDFEKVFTDGCHYAHMQSISKNRSTYAGQIFDVSLFTKNSETNEYYWVGEIQNLEVIDDLEVLQPVYDYYLEQGWLNEIELQLVALGIDAEHFREIGARMFCFRFLPEDARIYDPPKIIHPGDPIRNRTRYSTLMHFIETPALLENIPFQFVPGGNLDVVTGTSSASRTNTGYQIKHLHNEISIALYKYLVKKYGRKNVAREHSIPICNGCADMVLKTDEGLVFFEIKTYNTLKACIREAVGQLFEYNYFSEEKRAEEMVVISSMLPDETEKGYLKNLRRHLQLPLFYQCFDLKSNTLSNKF